MKHSTKNDRATTRAKLSVGAEEIRKAEQAATGKPKQEVKRLEIHPLAADVPPMKPKEYEDFREDVRKNGLTNPFITLYEGKILDGRHRDRVCRELGILRKFKRYEGKDPGGFVISKAVMRRQMTDDQRVQLVDKIRGPQLEAEAKERMKEGGQKKGSSKSSYPAGAGKATQQIAAEAKTSTYKSERAASIRKAGFADDVISGKKKARDAAKEAKAKAAPMGKSKGKPSKSFEERVRTRLNSLIIAFRKDRAEPKIRVALVESLLGRYDSADNLIMPESVTYPGKGTFTISDVLTVGFHFNEPPRAKLKPVTSHVIMEH